MGIQDLGKLFYKPINDGNGSIVLAIVNQISDPKQVGNLTSAVKWQSQAKLTKNSQPLDPLLPLLNVSHCCQHLAEEHHLDCPDSLSWPLVPSIYIHVSNYPIKFLAPLKLVGTLKLLA